MRIEIFAKICRMKSKMSNTSNSTSCFLKRFMVLFVLFFLFGCFLFSYDGGRDTTNNTINTGISTLFPENPKVNEDEDQIPLHPVTFSSLSVGFGGHNSIIPYILAPGLFFDMHFSLLSMLVEWLKDDEAYKTNENDFPLFFQTGLRLYNQLGINTFCIQPFFGLNLLGVLGKESRVNWYKVFGILAAFNRIGIEYSYQMPLLHSITDKSRAIHRIAIVTRLYT